MYEQKQDGLYSVYVHPVGGQLSVDDFKLILDQVTVIPEAEISLAMSEGLYVRNLNGREAEEFLELTKHIGGESRLERSVACIGVPTCQVGILDSQETLKEVITYFKEKNFTEDVLPPIHISGCTNSCSAHEIGEIGFCGKKLNVKGEVKEAFELHLGGKLCVGNAKLADHCGDILRESLPAFLYEIALDISEAKKDFYDWTEENQPQLESILNNYIIK